MPDDRMQTQSFSMPPGMVRAIKDVAASAGMPMSSVVRAAVRAYLAGQGYPYPAPNDPDDDQTCGDPLIWQ